MESRVGKVFGDSRIGMKCGANVGMKGFEVHDCGSLEYQRIEYGGLEGGCKLLISEHWSEIVRVDSCIIPFPLFRIDILSSSQCIQFGSEFSQTETNHEVELRKEFQPTGLPSCQNFGSRKIFKVHVVCDNVNWNWSSFKVMVPRFESFEDGQEFLVVNIVVQFWRHEGSLLSG